MISFLTVITTFHLFLSLFLFFVPESTWYLLPKQMERIKKKKKYI